MQNVTKKIVVKLINNARDEMPWKLDIIPVYGKYHINDGSFYWEQIMEPLVYLIEQSL